ncbi:nuclear transport factor 2 family protein [Amnibacterium sp. CER49]|uniref:nuclear transport factor 2 family protein n=1 Tax=Amnibacterium sp. CER49 TaxID=3039161 RepID=UPI00244942B7|nr:nuclear transport factor 2 family protein [Amnibacterium sp. CER49]MDH2445032.1 nuclear transport factor 2 family protein [Amnibacterium sp. CER49]
MTDREAVQDWVRRYERAWATNDPDDVRALFAPDGEYRFHPWDEPERGSEAILAAWLEAQDDADDHEFTWEVVAVDGDTAVVQGHTEYTDGDAYENLWILRLDDEGRARSFTEWYMEAPSD